MTGLFNMKTARLKKRVKKIFLSFGNEIEIKIRDNLHKAMVVERPFYRYHGKMNRLV